MYVARLDTLFLGSSWDVSFNVTRERSFGAKHEKYNQPNFSNSYGFCLGTLPSAAPNLTSIMKVAPSALVETTYNEMLEEVGGSWPPKSSFEDTWPSVLQPYATLCDKATDCFVIKILKAETPDGEETKACIGKKKADADAHPFATEDIDANVCPFANVSKMMTSPTETVERSVVAQQVEDMRDFIHTECAKLAPLEEVIMALSDIDNVKRNGFLACLAFLLHMYRWGICPIVEYAQLQTSMEFPDK